MTRKIFRSCFLVAVTVLLASLLLIMGALYEYFDSQYEQQLRQETAYIAQGVEQGGLDYCQALQQRGDLNARITWIESDGTVRYDSRSGQAMLENHADRQEVQQALQTGTGFSVRRSETLGRQTLNYAVRLDDGTVLRVSGTRTTVWMLLGGMLPPIFFVLIAAVVLSLCLAHRVSRRVAEPINHIDLEHPLENNEVYDELAPFLTRISHQNQQIQQQLQQLRERQEELATITAQMDEGLIVLGKDGTILSMNRRAAEIFGVQGAYVGKHLYSVSHNAAIMPVLEQAQQGQEAETELAWEGRRYQFLAAPVRAGQAQQGVVILLLDITQRSQAEQLRREFSANVSHELKTPLTSISGYAELMQSGMVRPEDMRPFAGKIYKEATRLMALVEDILQLSRLDEGTDLAREPVALRRLAETVAGRLEPLAAEKQVQIKIEGEDAVLEGSGRVLDEVLCNLMENAIKYNRPGGSVTVRVEQTDRRVVLTVSDTGIGIPQAHQSRVFERFYRVDKSHSKATGGTGLGLSIVKHGVLLHHGELSLQSQEGKGTTVTIVFPKA
ncbi:MAG: PAS domain-containing protein [Clostridiales bacterium]|nr:PAS domain-containing protein [Clostridiales bacterium]